VKEYVVCVLEFWVITFHGTQNLMALDPVIRPKRPPRTISNTFYHVGGILLHTVY